MKKSSVLIKLMVVFIVAIAIDSCKEEGEALKPSNVITDKSAVITDKSAYYFNGDAVSKNFINSKISSFESSDFNYYEVVDINANLYYLFDSEKLRDEFMGATDSEASRTNYYTCLTEDYYIAAWSNTNCGGNFWYIDKNTFGSNCFRTDHSFPINQALFIPQSFTTVVPVHHARISITVIKPHATVTLLSFYPGTSCYTFGPGVYPWSNFMFRVDFNIHWP